MDGKNKIHDTLHALQDSAGLTIIISVLWQIDHGVSMEDIRAELQDFHEELVERLMGTKSGRKQLAVICKNMSILTEDEEKERKRKMKEIKAGKKEFNQERCDWLYKMACGADAYCSDDCDMECPYEHTNKEAEDKEEPKMNIVEKIGTPAVLEQCAEECTELAQACLKIARKMRGENPTPATLDILMKNFNEEVADVLVCIETLVDGGFISNEAIDSVRMNKSGRWEERIKKMEAENEKEI